MKKLFLMAGAMAVLVFSSCKKDKDKGPDNNGGGNAKLLKKVTKTEDGSTVVFNMNYDGNKRVSSFNSADGSETTSFTYDNAGNVTKVERKEGHYFTTFTYTYNNGVPVSGTLKSVMKTAGEPDDVQQDDVLTYTLTNNQVTKIHTKSNLEDVEYDVNLSYKSNGNLDKAVLTGHEDYTYSIVYTFGSKKPAFPTLSKWVLDLGFSLEFAAKNELITTLMDFPGTGFDMEFTTTYTYDAAGYPLTSSLDGTNLKYEYQ
jgi:YD repeat-containing protein